VVLDPDEDYGDDYADGVLPVGDGRYRTDRAAKGYVYACDQYAQNLSNGMGGGAQLAGPWFSPDMSTYDIDEKPAVQGSVDWAADSSVTTKDGSTRRGPFRSRRATRRTPMTATRTRSRRRTSR
jgi:hypothetical protein